MSETTATEVLPGRDTEHRRLAEALASARAGRPQVVLVEGPGGIGKTTLIRRFVEQQDGVEVLWATGDRSERTLRFGLADQLLRRAGASGRRVALIGEPVQPAAVGLTLLETLTELQDRGTVVLVIDDAQWADPDSLQAVLFAARRLVAESVLVVVAARTRGLHALPEGLTRLAEPPDGARLALAPLDFGAVRTLARLRELPISAHALTRVFELSAGVPLHVCALLDAWGPSEGLDDIAPPPSYAALVLGRLSECGDACRRLVEAAAVVGDGAALADVAGMARVAAPLPALQEASARDLIRISNRSIEFVHPLVRAAVHDAIAPARLVELHGLAGTLADDERARLLHRAHAATGPDGPLADELEDAAWATAADGHWLRAADLLDEAGELSPSRAERERRTLDAVDALSNAGDHVSARSLVPRIERFAVSAERELVLGRLAQVELDTACAEQHLRAAWERRAAGDAQLGVRIASELASCAYFRLDAPVFLQWARRAMELTSIGDPANAPAVTKLAIALALNGRLGDGLALLDEALSSAAAHTIDVAQAQTARGRLRWVADDLPGALADLRAVIAAAEAPSRSAGLALARLSLVEYASGAWSLALTHAEQGLSTCVDQTDLSQLTALRASVVVVLAARGAFAEADQHLHAMLAERGEAPLPTVYMAFAGVHLAAARHDAEGVLAAAEPLREVVARATVAEFGFWPWQHLYAEALVSLGRLDEADVFLRPHEAVAGERRRESMIGRLARARGALESARGDDERAGAAFRRSAEALSAVSMPYELGLTELAHGRFLRRRRRRRAAAELLAKAAERFAAVGAQPALEDSRRELQASGLKPRRPDAKGTGGLTPQEVTVAQLVIAGMTNREIAAELLVSTKTVEVHLTSVYAKLELRSRSELRARARRGELAQLA